MTTNNKEREIAFTSHTRRIFAHLIQIIGNIFARQCRLQRKVGIYARGIHDALLQGNLIQDAAIGGQQRPLVIALAAADGRLKVGRRPRNLDPRKEKPPTTCRHLQ